MAKNVTAKEIDEQTETEEAVVVDIVRGRMPLAMVYVIRFVEEGTDGELARKYRTTPGKINDIKKNRNFAYVTEDTKFSAAEIDKAKNRAEQFAEADQEEVIAKLDALEEASEADVTALEDARKATRKPRGKGKEKAKAEDSGDELVEDEAAEETAAEEEDESLDDLLA